MDTPDRNRIGTPLSKFEDSPVFNYINSLSPIKPVKSINISQTFNSLSFAAIPSVFTSPHVKEFRPLGRHQSSDHCKYGNSSDNENRPGSSEVVTDAPLQRSPLGEASSESHNEHPKLCGGPDTNFRPCSSDDGDGVPELDGPSALHEKVTVQGKVHLQDIYQTQQKREEWESLISDAVDLLNFSSPDGTETLEGPFQKSNDPSTSFCTSLESEFPRDDFSDLHEQHTVPFSSDEQQEARDPSSELKEIEHERDNLADTSLGKCVTTNHGIKKTVDNAGKCLPFTSKPVSNLHRGMRRRCLLFEMPGGHRKNLKNASGGKIASNDKQVVTLKEHSETPSCILPGIGLHLNSLAATPKDHKTAKHEIMATGNHLAIVPISTASFSSASINQETTTMSLDLVCSERDKDPNENKAHVAEDTLQASAAIVESNQSSPKKKRRKFEQAGETEACKRCNCKKSKCLKLYCECFAAGVYCVEPCSCQDCFNKPVHEDTVLSTRKQIESRNPLAFAPKVVRTSDSVPEIGDEPNTTPASARHKRGCNCKKSSCLKKYCECYQGGVGCSVSCRCEGCKNAFGRKDGYASLGTDADQEAEETEPDSALPMTPLQIRRPSAQLPFSSRRKPPRSSFLSSGLSSVLGKRNFLPPEPKFEKHFRSNVEDEMPHILRGDTSPSSGIKTASPNSKRVSPPHCDYETSSPSRRSTRKLILRSIPSFPSLTQN